MTVTSSLLGGAREVTSLPDYWIRSWGPMSIRVASYFPFNVTCYLNGHSFVAQELTRDGIRFRKADNAVLAVDNRTALQAAADRLTATLLERRCNYWVRRLVPVFSSTERSALAPGYRYSTAQMVSPNTQRRHGE